MLRTKIKADQLISVEFGCRNHEQYTQQYDSHCKIDAAKIGLESHHFERKISGESALEREIQCEISAETSCHCAQVVQCFAREVAQVDQVENLRVEFARLVQIVVDLYDLGRDYEPVENEERTVGQIEQLKITEAANSWQFARRM